MWDFYRYPQDQVVYLWEDRTLHSWYKSRPSLSLKQCRDLVKDVCDRFEILLSVVKDGRGCKQATATRYCVQMPKYSRCEVVVLHECAHVIQYEIRDESDHEEEFVNIFICLLEMYMQCSKAELEHGMKQYNVRHQELTFQDITKLLETSKHQVALSV